MKMIEVKLPFKHDSQCFYSGERRMVTDADAAYFCANGWASAEGEPEVAAQPSSAKLDIHSTKHSTKGKVR